VWQDDSRNQRSLPLGQTLRPRFAGEQQISTAILALNQNKKPKVAFVRGGGPPLTTAMQFPFRGGPLSDVASRLKQYNFEVSEKDLSGMWAMQSQMQQMPTPPEPGEEQIKDAIWIVVTTPTQQQSPMGGPPPSVGPKVADHLKNGGSALIMFDLQTDAMPEVMKEWGIEVHTDAVA